MRWHSMTVVRKWDDVDPDFRDEVNVTARQLGSQRRGDA